MIVLLSDAFPNRYTPYPIIVTTVMIINVMIWTLTFFWADLSISQYLLTAVQQGDLWAAVLDLFVPEELFLLLFNLMGLWAFGRRLEDACGHGRFLLFFLICGLVANYVNASIFSGESRMGISGVVFGLVGAFIVVFPRGRMNMYIWVRMRFIRFTHEFTLSAWWLVIPMLLIQGLAVLGSGDGYYIAHFGAFVAGALAIFLFLRPDAFARRLHRVPI